jgi:hypothetical protein
MPINKHYCLFQVTFQSAVPKFVVNIPNSIFNLEYWAWNLQSQLRKLLTKVLIRSTELKY